MACSPLRISLAPIAPGETAVEICYPYFEVRSEPGQDPAFALHAAGLEEGELGAAFALIPAAPDQPRHFFIARWGRTGVGPTGFLPVPAQIEDDRPGVDIYGSKVSNFTWRNHQWEVTAVTSPAAMPLPSLSGPQVLRPNGSDGIWALLDGRPLADLDHAPPAALAAAGIQREEDADGFQFRFQGRVWRRHRKPHPGQAEVDLLAFDLDSAGIVESLDQVWSEIGGQEEAKRELVRAIQWPVLYPELFALFKRRRSRGVLLYGPPGTGKTLLGKAVARLLAVLYRRPPDDGGFQYIQGHQLLDQYVGNSEKAVKSLFDRARRWMRDKGYPAVLFFDEADALFRRRAGENTFSLVPALLAEMDGIDESGAFLVLATNRPDSLDQAVTRPGRIDRKIRVTRPSAEAATRIFEIHLDGVFLAEGWTLDRFSSAAARLLFDNRWNLYRIRFEDGEHLPFRLSHLASGALIQNIVDRATANKMEICIEQNVREGLSLTDMERALEELCEEQRLLGHSEEFAEWEEIYRRRIVETARA